MSAILDKPFDKAKKIAKTIFKGAPNLITAPDLNRQITQLTEQGKALDRRVGFITDLDVTVSYSNGNITVTPTCTYMEIEGVAFTPPASTPLVAPYGTVPVFMCLTATKSIVDYAGDAGRKISGAFFTDGTSKAAADHEVYSNETYVLTETPNTLNNLIGIVAKIERIGLNFSVTVNGIPRGSSLLFQGGKFKYNTSVPSKINNGMSYDEALSVVSNRIEYEDPAISEAYVTLKSDSSLPEINGAKLIHKRGRLFLDIPTINITTDGNTRHLYMYVISLSDAQTSFIIPYNKIAVPQNAYTGGTLVTSPTARTFSAYSVGAQITALLNNVNLVIYGTGVVTPVYGIFLNNGEPFIGLAITWSGQTDTWFVGENKTSAYTNMGKLGTDTLIQIPASIIEFYLK
jgi:hypothetical protein